MKFTQLALALHAFIDHNAEQQYLQRRGHRSGGISLENICWDDGRLPFLVRRDSERKLDEWWFLDNGTGEVLWSWRVELVPYLESMGGASLDYSQPWTAPRNRRILQRYGYYFSYVQVQELTDTPDAFPEANALAICGPGTAFGCEGEEPKRRRELPPDLILIVEVPASGIPWPAPGDLDIRTMAQVVNPPDGKGISSKYRDGFHVVFADGEVWFISKKVPFELLRKFFTIEEAAKHNRDELLQEYAIWRSGVRIWNRKAE